VLDWFRSFQEQGLKPPPDWVAKLPVVGDLVANRWADLAENTERTMALLREGVAKSQVWLLKHSLVVLEGIAQMCLSVLIAFFFYRDGEVVVQMLIAGVRKIAGDDTQHLLATVGGTVKGVVYGILCTAVAQGLAAGIGFRIAGMQSALVLGFLTFLLSFVPGGPPIVWIPVTVWLFFNGHPGLGVFMAVWGFLVISGVDNLVRPYVISRDTKQSFALVLLGVLGGILAFGFIGLFIGPTLLAVGATLVRQFVARKRGVAKPPDTAPAA
jgi:predicted PurR-regulated permease PerM